MTAVVDKENCTGCAACVDACPTDAIAMVDDKAQINEDECTDCGACVDECPTGAIELN